MQNVIRFCALITRKKTTHTVNCKRETVMRGEKKGRKQKRKRQKERKRIVVSFE